eukprot:6134-Eustigmatos_ZCMA.PRE.1
MDNKHHEGKKWRPANIAVCLPDKGIALGRVFGSEFDFWSVSLIPTHQDCWTPLGHGLGLL